MVKQRRHAGGGGGGGETPLLPELFQRAQSCQSLRCTSVSPRQARKRLWGTRLRPTGKLRNQYNVFTALHIDSSM